ncbi:MAG TPA: reverse transcriptase domain-containing protein, partial [Oculatellaceae cyanobacterium]
DISAYLLFTFWQLILYLDHEAEWPASKERSGHWIGVANGIGDALTFWILHDQFKYILARSVVRPFNQNLRVKWGPTFANAPIKNTAIHANDVIPKSVDVQDLSDEDDKHIENVIPEKTNPIARPTYKQDYTNLGLDTSHLALPKGTGPVTRSKGKLALDNTPLAVDESIETFTRSKKKGYKHVKYKEKYVPEEHVDEIQSTKPRRSDRLKGRPPTVWKQSKESKALLTNTSGITLLPLAIQAVPISGMVKTSHGQTNEPLSPKDEKLRAYHAQIDLMHTIIHPDQQDLDWQVENISKWTTKTLNGLPTIFLKIHWIGGDKQWIPMEDIMTHDPFLAIRYAIRNKLTNTKEWEWTKEYMDSDTTLTKMLKAYKVSRFLKNIKFGVEVPQSTRHAFSIDASDGTSLWQAAMKTEINQLYSHETFRVLNDNEAIPAGYKLIPYHCVYDVKFDGRRKCRLVAGGHRTDPSDDEVFSGVVSMETVRICFTLAKVNSLEVCAGDIGNAFLYGKSKEKVYIIAGPEFGPKLQGKRLIIYKALYGLKSSSARFHEHLSSTLLKLGFKPSKADYDLWIRKSGDHYEYVTKYVDDVVVFSKDPMAIIVKLQETYTMKDIGKPQYYLGG